MGSIDVVFYQKRIVKIVFIRMNKIKVLQWCRENNWLEPRQLDTGDWVAFPPGGVIETPLPQDQQLLGSSKRLLDVLYALILIVSGLVVAVISIAISPLFLVAIVRRYRQRQSQITPLS